MPMEARKNRAVLQFAGAISFLLPGLLCGSAAAQKLGSGAEPQKETVFTIDAALLTKYIWRGQLLTDGPVAQAFGEVQHKGLVLNAWGNMDITDKNDDRFQVNEIDLSAGYGHEFDSLSLEGGLIYYLFPNTTIPNTVELYSELSFDMILNPTLSAFIDIDEADGGSYWKLGVDHSFDFGQLGNKATWSFDLLASAALGSPGYNNFYFDSDKWGGNDFQVALLLPFKFANGLTFTPQISFSYIMNRSLCDNPGSIYGGISVNYVF